MSANGEDIELDAIETDYDQSAHQGCYIFRTAEAGAEDISDRPKKKRKVSKSKTNEREGAPFPRLLGGIETEECRRLRKATFEQLWVLQQTKIDKIIAEPDRGFVDSIARFVRNAPNQNPESEARLPTGLIVVGKDSGAQHRLLRQLQIDERTKPSEYLIQLDHNHAANITSALKSIIRSVISSSLAQDGYVDFLSKHKRLLPINYDLELLQRFAETKAVEKIVISIFDIESFDVSVLSDLMAMLASWTDRVPFILLIDISTTVDLFEARLPKAAIRHLIIRIFDISNHASNPMYKMFMATQRGASNRLWLGPAASNALLEKSKEQETTPEVFARALKYAYMSHFFANFLSVLAAPDVNLDEDTQVMVCEAIRNTASFTDYLETILNTPGPKGVKAQEIASLLNDDQFLLTKSLEEFSEGQDKMGKHYEAVAGLKAMIISLRNRATAQGRDLPEFDFTADLAVSDDIFDASVTALAGPVAVEIILENLGFHDTLERMPADAFYEFISSDCHATVPFLESKAHKTLQQRTKALSKASERTALFLSPDPKQATPNQKEYQDIQATFVSLVEDGLRDSLVDPTTLPFHEAFIYNSKTPLAQVFTPGPRYAIERALDRPADYLGCECCLSADGSSQPPTAILWRLWCEAGGVVNVRDLWEAFKATLIPQSHDDEDEEEGSEPGSSNERQALTLFYRSLAELQMLGMLKQSKRRPGVECLAKIGWRGM